MGWKGTQGEPLQRIIPLFVATPTVTSDRFERTLYLTAFPQQNAFFNKLVKRLAINMLINSEIRILFKEFLFQSILLLWLNCDMLSSLDSGKSRVLKEMTSNYCVKYSDRF